MYSGRVEALAGPYPGLARRLEGAALIRLSTAWWRGGKEWIDALGLAMRLGREPSVEAHEGDQDLLFATIRRPWTTLLAPLTTEQHDFLANDYYAVSPFDVAIRRGCGSRPSVTARASPRAGSCMGCGARPIC